MFLSMYDIYTISLLDKRDAQIHAEPGSFYNSLVDDFHSFFSCWSRGKYFPFRSRRHSFGSTQSFFPDCVMNQKNYCGKPGCHLIASIAPVVSKPSSLTLWEDLGDHMETQNLSDRPDCFKMLWDDQDDYMETRRKPLRTIISPSS